MKKIMLEKTKKLISSVFEYRDLIHVITGPRQIGKTTAAKQIIEHSQIKAKYVTSDGEISRPKEWIQVVWDEAEREAVELLIIDEIQNVEEWSVIVKRLWDARTSQLSLILLGSSSLQIHRRLSESLAGRYLLHKFHHWSFEESRQLANLNLEQYLTFGGYPGSYQLLSHKEQWNSYIKDSIILPVIGKDILSQAHVKSSALFKQCFDLICSYAAQEISYTKLLGQLQSKGNTDLVKHYIELLEAAFLVKSLQKFSLKQIKKRSSSPKLLPLCPALFAVTKNASLLDEDYGRSFEIAVAMKLLSLTGDLYYWREKSFEVDFVYHSGQKIFAIEVKYRKNHQAKGLEKFLSHYPEATSIIVTPENFDQLTSFLEV